MGKVVIFGAAGYLGRFVVERLLPHHELVLADISTGTISRPDARSMTVDVRDFGAVQAACEGADAAVNLVALVRQRHGMPPGDFCDIMVKGTWHIAEACVRSSVRRLVNISSVIAAGGMPQVETAHHPEDGASFGQGDLFYCLSKHLGEQVGLAYHQAHGLEIVHLRPGVIDGDGANVGPGDPPSEPRPWFIYVDPRDVAQAVQSALISSVKYGCYNIVAGRCDSLFDWSDAQRDLGYKPEHNWPHIPLHEVASR